MGRVRSGGRDWVKSIFLDSNVDPGTCFGKITATVFLSL